MEHDSRYPAAFNLAFDQLMDYEGLSYSNDAADRGGETAFGISKRSPKRAPTKERE